MPSDYYILQAKMLEWQYEDSNRKSGYAHYNGYRITWNRYQPYRASNGVRTVSKDRKELDRQQEDFFIFIADLLYQIDNG